MRELIEMLMRWLNIAAPAPKDAPGVRRCEYCERPFVDYSQRLDHEKQCRQATQARLDAEWEART
jgi:hypothetical protein